MRPDYILHFSEQRQWSVKKPRGKPIEPVRFHSLQRLSLAEVKIAHVAEAKIENLTERMIKLEMRLELLMHAGGFKKLIKQRDDRAYAISPA
ncbi:hypothetical protein [Herbaspirillum rubrisubalbicans]|uniref:hypothetical protein n=1 Tax=Herbaspirillum rubrisubalbicans TaxID=80842 RepID=UPI000DD38C56|nr:hypothetical protein [Herbaspirillum rubrisubalbicans]